MEGFVLDVMQQYGAAIVSVAGVLGALIFIWKKGIVPARRWAIHVGATIESLNEVAHAQLSVNGGSSLLDKVNMIEPNHAEVKADLAAQTELVKAELLKSQEIEAEWRKEVDRRLRAIEDKGSTVVIHNDPHIGGGPT